MLQASARPLGTAVWLALVGIATVGGLLPLAAQEDDEEPPRGWRGTADFGLTLTEGNSETTNISLGLSAIHRLAEQRWTFSSSFLRATSAGETTANRLDLEGKYDFYPDDRVFVFAEVAGGFNRPAGIDRRLRPGLGGGYEILRRDQLSLSAEGGANFIQDHFVDETTDEAVYFSAGQSLELTVSESTDLTQSLRYSPRAENFSDYLLQFETVLGTAITDDIGLKVTFRDDFDSDPFVDEEGERRARNDITLITGLTYSF